MKFILAVCILILILEQNSLAQGAFTTINPKVARSAVNQVIIKRIELTKQYTILFLKYTSDGSGSGDIRFSPTARLLTDNGKRIYKYIRAENIGEYTNRHVAISEQVDFVIYFQRIDPGFTLVDLYECNSIEAQGDCWNFSGIHIINPSQKQIDESQTTASGHLNDKVVTTQIPNTLPPKKTAEINSKEKLSSISGLIKSRKTNQPLASILTLIKLSGSNRTQPTIGSSGPTGMFTISNILPGTYILSSAADGYFNQSDTVTVQHTDVAHNVDLVLVEVGAKIELKNLFFDASKSDLAVDSFFELDRLVRFLKQTPTIQIRLEGHTDIIGDFDANVLLSRTRVNEVKKYLVSKGITDERIKTVGYGPSRPVNKNKLIKERPENRRVELVIIKM